MLPCDQGFDHPFDRTFGAILFPFGVDRGVDQAALGIVEAVDMATHLTDDRLQHGDAIEPINFVALRLRRVDHREGKIGRAHVELKSLMRRPSAVFCWEKKQRTTRTQQYIEVTTSKRI